MPSLALSMIVCNAAATLADCLESVRGVVDEMVIADTGSTDATESVALRYGARILSIPWEQDFAAARNKALAQVKSDWVLVLDADEMLEVSAGDSIRSLLRDGVGGYHVSIRNYVRSLNERVWDRAAQPNTSGPPQARQYPAYVEHENVRLFRCHPEIYFVGRVHETVGPKVLACGFRLERANFVIHHFGLMADPEIRQRKSHLYRELGRAKVREMPEDAQAHFELGLEEFNSFKDYEAALACFKRARELNPHVSIAWLFSGLALLRLGRSAEALRCLEQAQKIGPQTALISEAMGDAYYNLGDFESARRAYRRALQQVGSSAYLQSKMGLVEFRLGRVALGLAAMKDAVTQEPYAGELYDRLMAVYALSGNLREAAETAEAKLHAVEPEPASYMRAASIRAQLQDWSRALTLLREGVRQFPDAQKLRQALAEIEGMAGQLQQARCQAHKP